jgi:broad specificity phosphatase PhoE
LRDWTAEKNDKEESGMANGPIRTRRLAISATAIALIAIIGWVVIFWLRSTTVALVVRHAERNDAGNCSPATVKTRPNRSLNLVGGQSPRAEILGHVGEQDGIAAIYASEFCRTQQTVQPLATKLGLTVNVVDQYSADGVNVNVDNLVNQVWANNRGQVVLIAGHTNTVPPIIEKLSGITVDAIDEAEFDNLYIVIIPRWWGKPKVVRLKYGAPT